MISAWWLISIPVSAMMGFIVGAMCWTSGKASEYEERNKCQ